MWTDICLNYILCVLCTYDVKDTDVQYKYDSIFSHNDTYTLITRLVYVWPVVNMNQ